MSTIGVCKYCNENKTLIDAHIVPKGFLGDVSNQKFLEVSTEYKHTKKRPKGPYDQKILCAACDGSIGVYDEYAKSILIDRIESYRDSQNPFYQIPHQALDYQKLKKFFISLIWRASISDAGIFNRVSLGPYDDIALSQMKGDMPLDNNIFAVILFKDSASLKYSNVITFASTQLAGKKAYKIHFSGYQVTIIPNIKGMSWTVTNGAAFPEECFFREGSDFYILEVDQDVSSKEDMLRKIYKRYI